MAELWRVQRELLVEGVKQCCLMDNGQHREPCFVDRGERGELLMGRQQEIQGSLMTGLWVDNGGCRGALSRSEEWVVRGCSSTDNGECGYLRAGVGSCCWVGFCKGCGRSRWMEGGGELLKVWWTL